MLQSVTVQSSAKVAETASADPSVARVDGSFDLIGFVQVAASAQNSAAGASVDASAPAKPLDPLTALMNIGQLAEKGLKTSTFTEAVAADQGVTIHVFPTPDGAGVDTIRDLPLVTAADLEHAVSLLPASAEKDMVLALIHDPQTIAAAMKAAGLFNPAQMQVAGKDLQTMGPVDQAPALVDPSSSQNLPPFVDQSSAPVLPQIMTDPTQTDPAVFAAEQALMMQPVLPQVQPVPAPEPALDLTREPQPVLLPEILSGPWGDYQSPVMPDQRFVRFIVPKSDTPDAALNTSLFGIELPDGAAFAPITSDASGHETQSVMAALADVALAMPGSEIQGLASPETGPSLTDRLAALAPKPETQTGMSTTLLTQETVSESPLASQPAAPAIAPSAASLFSSIFAKHGISQSGDEKPVLAGSASSDTALNTSSPVAGFDTTPVLAALSGLVPQGLAPQGFVPPQPFQPAASDDASGDAVRSSLLKSLGGLKTAPAKGGLAAQLVNSQQILDLAAEEGLALPQPVSAAVQPLPEHNPELVADGALQNSGFAPIAKNNAFASAGDAVLSPSSGLDAAATGQGQAGGQGSARQDGHSASQQSNARLRDEAAFVAAASGIDEVVRAAAKKEDAFSALSAGHQTTVASDGAGFEAPTFSTASMAASAPAAPVSGAALGARETLLGVTYALANYSPTGSAVAAEMRFMSLGQQVMAALKQNSQEIELRLNPAQLGNVVLKLQVEGQRLSISAKTESQLSDEALSAGEDGLRASLAANGYQLDKFDVSHQDERRKPNRPESERSQETERSSDDPFSFDLIA